MRRYLYSIILYIIFTQPTVYAQKSYLPGYVIPMGSDTLRGYINYLNWSKNPTSIQFKVNPESVVQRYEPSDLSGFYVKEEHYVKANVPVDISPVKTSELTNSPTPALQNRMVFLRVLVRGPKSLYYLKDDTDKIHFYIREGENYQLLTNYRYRFQHDGQESLITQDHFKQQLLNYLSNCLAVEKKITSLQYSPQSLEQIFREYYAHCAPEKPSVLMQAERLGVQTGVMVGVSVTNIRFNGSNHPFLTKVDFPISTQATAGLFLDLLLPRTRQRWAIRSELVYTSWRANGQYEVRNNENDYSLTEVSLAYGHLKLNNLIRYQFPVSAFQMFLHAGLTNGLMIQQENYLRKEKYFFSDQADVTEGKAIEEVRKYEQGLLLGAGASLKRYSLEVRYEASNGMSAYTNLSSPIGRFYTFLAFRF